MIDQAKTKVRRAPQRGHYDRETIFRILDQNYVCQVGFIHQNYPVVIPTLYGRKEDKLFIHGASVSRMILELEKEIDLSLNVTRVHGLVLARSAFHHSINYESVVIFGKGKLVAEPDKLEALKIISDQVIPGRWQEVRLPNQKELKATKVIEISLQEASAKIRTGDPKDESADYELDIWAGVIPVIQAYGKPQPETGLPAHIPLPESVKRLPD